MEITQIAVAGTVESIQARTITAIHRAAKKDAYDWKEIDSWNA